MKLRLRMRWERASDTTPFLPSSLGSMVLAYMNFTVAPWLVVGRRMGVKVLMYLKFRNRGEFRICSYCSE